MPMVGTFFYGADSVGKANTSCTGSVVRSAGKNMVLTAGHCADDMKKPNSHAVFVPQYRHGKAPGAQPHGIFPVKVNGVYIDPRYHSNSKGADSDLDLAFALVEPNGKGQAENVTGALTFTPGSTYDHKVTVVGYPSGSSVNKDHRAFRCDVPTTRLAGYRQMQMLCNGFYSGVSGGPWIKDYDAATRTGKVIGNTGGYYGGGDDANHSWITYAPVYGKDAQDLYDDAGAGRDPDKLPGRRTRDPRTAPSCPASGTCGPTPRRWPPATSPATAAAACSWSGRTARSPSSPVTARAASCRSASSWRPTAPGSPSPPSPPAISPAPASSTSWSAGTTAG